MVLRHGITEAAILLLLLALVFLFTRDIVCSAVLRKSRITPLLNKIPALPSPLTAVINHGPLLSLGLLVPVACCAIHSAMQVRRLRHNVKALLWMHQGRGAKGEDSKLIVSSCIACGFLVIVGWLHANHTIMRRDA